MNTTATVIERRKSSTNAKPIYAFVGAGDLALEKIRDATAMMSEGRISLPPNVKELRHRVSSTVADVQSAVGDTVGALADNPGAFVRGQYGKAVDAYDDLAVRGYRVVERARGKLEDAEEEAKRVKDRTWDDATRIADEIKDEAKRRVDDARDKAEEVADATEGKAKEVAGRAKDGARGAGSRAKPASGTATAKPRTARGSKPTPPSGR
ncbi:hypothetical protein [Yinghuangia seranimata]|uniref:hypothetical protein n=1 Tax=Yinghuangia seranimata TaxID=408067 RepID=UPI00248D2DB0|nr:hypothetical protein [Yinghuangia seranimata]MDI2125509.1 hypothetical protein [Yinghuangia seranimata]